MLRIRLSRSPEIGGALPDEFEVSHLVPDVFNRERPQILLDDVETVLGELEHVPEFGSNPGESLLRFERTPSSHHSLPIRLDVVVGRDEDNRVRATVRLPTISFILEPLPRLPSSTSPTSRLLFRHNSRIRATTLHHPPIRSTYDRVRIRLDKLEDAEA